MDQIVRFTDAFNVRYPKASSLHYAAKLKVGFRTVESVHHPFHFLQASLLCIPLRERRERGKHAFASAIDLRQFDERAFTFDLAAAIDSEAFSEETTIDSKIRNIGKRGL